MMRTKVQCKDGSWTFYNDDVGESYHTPLGAAMEAREKFAGAVGLEARAKSGRIVILDVCYGLGYNTAAALEIIRGVNPDCLVEMYGLEVDKSIVDDALSVPFPFEFKDVFSSLAKGFDEKTRVFRLEQGKLSMRILIGDARARIKEVPVLADVVFFDAFSPKKQPELWSEDFFKEVFRVCADNAVLVTYSCARQVRENLRTAGFMVEDGPLVGRRGPATVARATKHS